MLLLFFLKIGLSERNSCGIVVCAVEKRVEEPELEVLEQVTDTEGVADGADGAGGGAVGGANG